MHRNATLGMLALLTACSHYQPCGTFTFDAQPAQASKFIPTDVPLAVGFDFNPAQCKPPMGPCQCDRIVYLQIIRIDPGVQKTVYKDRFSIFPDDEYFTRQTVNGWSIDVTARRKLGYYGLDDDGNPITATIVVPGRNGPSPITARLHDTPSFSATVWGANQTGASPHATVFEAVDAPVCVQPPDSPCNNKILGYLYWRIRADDQQNILEAAANFGDDDYTVVIQEAIAAWNADIGNWKKPLPMFVPLR